MRGILVAAALSVAALSSGPTGAHEDLLSFSGVAPLPANVLAVTAGGSADAAPAAMTSTSTAQASISNSSIDLAGRIVTGDVALGSVSAASGFGSLQAATGIGNIQQNSIAVVLSF
jgi:hypothetical protein